MSGSQAWHSPASGWRIRRRRVDARSTGNRVQPTATVAAAGVREAPAYAPQVETVFSKTIIALRASLAIAGPDPKQRPGIHSGNKSTRPNERKNVNNKFDELAKSLAQSVSRRAALKKFGVGLAGMALACFGLANKAEADPGCGKYKQRCATYTDCCSFVCNYGSCGCTSDKDCVGKNVSCESGQCIQWL